MAKKVEVTCPQCNGSGRRKYPGKKHEDVCGYCGGTGRVEKWV